MNTQDTSTPDSGRRRSERGASAVEYGLLISGIAAIIVTAVFLFGGAVNDLFVNSCTEVDASVASGTC